MGTMVGDDGAGNQIGVAPGAKWIGCRNMEEGWGWAVSYMECFQWFVAPTDLNGENPRPDLAPHVINNSWECPLIEGCDSDAIALRLRTLCQESASNLADQLELLVRFDDLQGWKRSGANHCGAWMNQALGISLQLGWEYLRVGRQLRDLPITRALHTAGEVAANTVIAETVDAARLSITEGASVAQPLRASGEFPPLVTHMIQVGEQSGELEAMLAKVADTYEEQVETTVTRLTALLEPFLILIMVGIVLVIILATLVPLLQITSSLG